MREPRHHCPFAGLPIPCSHYALLIVTVSIITTWQWKEIPPYCNNVFETEYYIENYEGRRYILQNLVTSLLTFTIPGSSWI